MALGIPEKIEGEFDTFIERTNTTLKSNAPEAGINVKTENYQRGIFTSNADIVIDIKENSERKNTIIKFATKIFHGPFPINKIVKLNLLPRLASTTIELVKNKTTKELFKYTQEPRQDHKRFLIINDQFDDLDEW